MQPTAHAEGGTVLVVDDDPDVRGALTDAFESEGFRVMTAANGMQALHRARDTAPDVIVLDLNMPMMSGDAFLYAWRAGAETYSVPVVAISAAYPGLQPEDLGGRGLLPEAVRDRPPPAARQGLAGVSATVLRGGARATGGGGQRHVAGSIEGHERDSRGRRGARQRPVRSTQAARGGDVHVRVDAACGDARPTLATSRSQRASQELTRRRLRLRRQRE